MSIKFVAELPSGNPRGGLDRSGRGSAFTRLLDELAKRPGEWAEVQREPRERAKNAVYRSSYLKKRGIESTTRMVGDECIVFARVTQ